MCWSATGRDESGLAARMSRMIFLLALSTSLKRPKPLRPAGMGLASSHPPSVRKVGLALREEREERRERGRTGERVKVLAGRDGRVETADDPCRRFDAATGQTDLVLHEQKGRRKENQGQRRIPQLRPVSTSTQIQRDHPLRHSLNEDSPAVPLSPHLRLPISKESN